LRAELDAAAVEKDQAVSAARAETTEVAEVQIGQLSAAKDELKAAKARVATLEQNYAEAAKEWQHQRKLSDKNAADELKSLKKQLKHEKRAKERVEAEVAEWAQKVAGEKSTADKASNEQALALAELRGQLETTQAQLSDANLAVEDLRDKVPLEAQADDAHSPLQRGSPPPAELPTLSTSGGGGESPSKTDLEKIAWCSWERPLVRHRSATGSSSTLPYTLPAVRDKVSFEKPSLTANVGHAAADSPGGPPVRGGEEVTLLQETITVQDEEIAFLQRSVMKQIELSAMLKKRQTILEKDLATAQEQVTVLVALAGEDVQGTSVNSPSTSVEGGDQTNTDQLEDELRRARKEIDALTEMVQLASQFGT